MDRIELRAAQLLGYPQLQQPFAVQCVDGGRRELAALVGELRFRVEEWRQHLGPFGQDRSFGQCVAERHGNGPLRRGYSSGRAYAGTPARAASILAVVSLLRPAMNRLA